jgi:hypothetical protein
VDFDFFSERHGATEPTLTWLEKVTSRFMASSVTPFTVIYEEVKLSFIGGYPLVDPAADVAGVRIVPPRAPSPIGLWFGTTSTSLPACESDGNYQFCPITSSRNTIHHLHVRQDVEELCDFVDVGRRDGGAERDTPSVGEHVMLAARFAAIGWLGPESSSPSGALANNTSMRARSQSI